MAGSNEIYRATQTITLAAQSTVVSGAIALPVNPSDYTIADIIRVEYALLVPDLGVEHNVLFGLSEDSTFAAPRTFSNDDLIDLQVWASNFTTSGNGTEWLRVDQDIVYGRLTTKSTIYLVGIDGAASGFPSITCRVYYMLKKVTAAQLVAFLS